MAPAPIELDAIAAFEAASGFSFPPAFRRKMSLANGGLVRTGASHWWLFQIPGSEHRFPAPIMWLGDQCSDLATFMQVVANFPAFPGHAVPFGLRRFARSADGILCFLRAGQHSPELLDEVWEWSWGDQALRPLLGTSEELWRDDPFGMPKPKQEWKVKRQKLVLPSGRRLGWAHIAAVDVLGKRLGVTDGAGGDWGDAAATATEPGPHDFYVQFIADGRSQRVAGLKLVRQGVQLDSAVRVGTVDAASVLVADIEIVQACDEAVLDALSERLMELALDAKPVGRLSFGPTTLLQASSGNGDGCCAVLQLLAAGMPAGIEVRFERAGGLTGGA